jgi:hypothetical protein
MTAENMHDMTSRRGTTRGSDLAVEMTAQSKHFSYVKTRAWGLHLAPYLHIENTTRATSVSHAMGWHVERATRAVLHGATGS